MQKKLNDILLLYAPAVEMDEGIAGEDQLFIIIVDSFKRRKFPIYVVFSQHVGYLNIQSFIAAAGHKIDLSRPRFVKDANVLKAFNTEYAKDH